MTPALEEVQGGCLLRLRVIPRAKATRIDGLQADALKVRVAAPPTGGKANAAVLDLIAGALGVRPRDLTLVSGARGRDKTLRIVGLGPAQVGRRLSAAG